MTSFDKSDKTIPEDSPRDVGAGADLKAAPRQDEGAVADASSPDGSNSAGRDAGAGGIWTHAIDPHLEKCVYGALNPSIST